MMHSAKLSPHIRRRLKDTVFLQLRILQWATKGVVFTQESLEQTLAHRRKYKNRAKDIAKWVWNSKYRKEPLEKFFHGPQSNKTTWLQRISLEAIQLFRAPTGGLVPFNQNGAPDWELGGANFLQQFYEDFNSEAGLPDCFFTSSTANKFTRQEFLTEFRESNRKLRVCAACEESDYYSGVRGGGATSIDHYFPKGAYPHLSVHPYNLHPLCCICNSYAKQGRDPLQGESGRRNLEDIWLPYREQGLSAQTYLEVIVSKRTRAFGSMHPRQGFNPRQGIEVIGYLFDIPARWKGRVENIEENLIREIMSSVKGMAPSVKPGATTDASVFAQHLQECLQVLLGQLDGRMGKQPWIFSMLWLLCTLAKVEVEPVASGKIPTSPLLDEVRAQLDLDARESERFQARGRELQQSMK